MTRARIGTDAGNQGGTGPDAQASPETRSIILGSDVTFFEANLEKGTAQDATALTKTIDIPEESHIDFEGDDRWMFDEKSDTYKMPAQHGYFEVDKEGLNFRYTLTKAAAHEPGVEAVEDRVEELKLVDQAGNETLVPAIVQITDDEPVITHGYENNTVISPGESVQGGWDVNFGADGEAGYQLALTVNGQVVDTSELSLGAPFEIVVDGVRYGQLTVNPDKTYSVQADPDLTEKVEASLEITATDNDGDTKSTGPLNLTIQPQDDGEEFDPPVLGLSLLHI